MADFSYGIITVSDSCHLGKAIDESGPTLKLLLQKIFKAQKINQTTVPDESNDIEEMLKYYSDELKLNCVLTTGGTGFSPRDVTPEATKRVIQRHCQQLTLAMALESFKKTQFAALSRAICGIRDKTLIINLPGSKKAVVECFEAISSVLPHALELICDKKAATVATHNALKNSNSNVSSTKLPESSVTIDSTSAITLMSSNASEMSEIADLLEMSSSSMEEIFLKDDNILKMPTRKNVEKNLKKSISSDTESYTESERSFTVPKPAHVCPHKTAKAGDPDDRNSPFPMLDVEVALNKVFSSIKLLTEPMDVKSPMDCPPFRASIKDGYAVKSTCKAKTRLVIGNVSAGNKLVKEDFADNECFKINTGAAVPVFADAIIQVEDTKLLETSPEGVELKIELLQLPKANTDIREIGSDILKNELLFTVKGLMDVPEKTILASVGLQSHQKMPKIAIISTGDELVEPSAGELREGQIYDSNTTMLKLLLQKYGFNVMFESIAKDDYKSLKIIVEQAMRECDVIISSGGVSMGDKDFVKPLMKELGFDIVFGRVNMKPGKPMTFASKENVSFFALPGNPVSAYVTFHIFVLPALRYMCGFSEAKSRLPTISVILQQDKYVLDPRPEFARARITYSRSKHLYYAHISGNQMSSRLVSLLNADVLLHLPGGTEKMPSVNKGFKVQATIIDQNFISGFQN